MKRRENMKSLEELNALKEKMKNKVAIRQEAGDKTKIIVGMATCGIAAGARPVLLTLSEEIANGGLEATVSQAGCIGMCQYEPIVEVFEPGKDKVTYVNMDAEKAKKVVEAHVKGGKIVTEYTVGSVMK
jgi:NADP-reducing hydrogenase subunit HndB